GRGSPRDERDICQPVASWGGRIEDLLSGAEPYYLEEWTPEQEDAADAGDGRPIPHAVISLKTDGGVVGMLSVDNLLSGRSVTEANVEALLPFAEQAAVAIRNARLLAERERLVERQRRFVEIAAAINASLDLDTILRMVRSAAVEVGGFDRAGVWTMSNG